MHTAASSACRQRRPLRRRCAAVACLAATAALSSLGLLPWSLRRPPFLLFAQAASRGSTSADLDRAVHKLNGLKVTHPDVFWQWRIFCAQEGSSTFNPKELSAGFIEQFLARHPSLPAVEMASTDLCQKLTALREKDAAVWWLFAKYASEEAFGITEPHRLPADIVQSFLVKYAEGALPAVELASAETVAKLQTLRRSGSGWNEFCAERTYGVRDPGKLPAEMAQEALRDFSPKQRQPKPVKLGLPKHQQLDDLRRREKGVLWQWRSFCAEVAGGIFDPQEVSEDLVQQFLERHAQGELPAVDLAPDQLCQELDELKRREPAAMWCFAEYSARAAYGIRNPHLMPAEVVKKFLTDCRDSKALMVEMATNDMVEKLLKLKKVGNGWRGFCEERSFGIRDPKRLPAAVAQRFLEEFEPIPFREVE